MKELSLAKKNASGLENSPNSKSNSCTSSRNQMYLPVAHVGQTLIMSLSFSGSVQPAVSPFLHARRVLGHAISWNLDLYPALASDSDVKLDLCNVRNAISTALLSDMLSKS
jgi:hypothetical protein